ncbi:MAG: FkbM family methyltransferase [Candidatus Omnitrophota bacterium]|jgi:FkbM family methyltransferase
MFYRILERIPHHNLMICYIRKWLRMVGALGLLGRISRSTLKKDQLIIEASALDNAIQAYPITLNEATAIRIGTIPQKFSGRLYRDGHLIDILATEISSGDVFWDIGANIGAYSFIASVLVGKKGLVISIEPEKKSFELLKANMGKDSLGNVCIFNIGFGSSNAKVPIFADQDAESGTHSLLKNSGNANESAQQMVSIYRGDEFYIKQKLAIPNIIKLDVEGFELNVLLGLKNVLLDQRCQSILCEVHFQILSDNNLMDTPSKIINLLKICGFKNIRWLDLSHFLAKKS